EILLTAQRSDVLAGEGVAVREWAAGAEGGPRSGGERAESLPQVLQDGDGVAGEHLLGGSWIRRGDELSSVWDATPGRVHLGFADLPPSSHGKDRCSDFSHCRSPVVCEGAGIGLSRHPAVRASG